jgi:hypothetical protein
MVHFFPLRVDFRGSDTMTKHLFIIEKATGPS